MFKQLDKCSFRQLAFSTFVVATSALFEEVRVGIVVLLLLICLIVPQKCLLVGCRFAKKACLASRRIRRENMKRRHAASEGNGSHLPVKKARSQQPWYQHLKNYAQTESMFRF